MRSATRRADPLAAADRPPAGAGCWFTKDQLARSRGRHRHRGVVLAARDVVGLAIPVAFLLGRLGNRLIAHHGRGQWVVDALVVVAALELVAVPPRLVLDGVDELRPDPEREKRPRAVQFAASFVGLTLGRLTTFAVGAIIALAVVRRTPWWPLALWLAALGATVAWGWLGPMVLAPVVDRPVPLDRDDLRASLADLARRAGVPLTGVLVARPGITAGEGAYVAGLRRSRRLVIDGVTLEGPASEIEVLVAHELGHWRLGHWRGSLALAALLSASALGGVWLIGSVSGRDLGQPASLPIWLLTLQTSGLLGSLLLAGWSRHQEHQADAFAASLVGASVVADHLRRHCVRAGIELEPSGWSRWRADHPAPSRRLARLAGGRT